MRSGWLGQGPICSAGLKLVLAPLVARWPTANTKAGPAQRRVAPIWNEDPIFYLSSISTSRGDCTILPRFRRRRERRHPAIYFSLSERGNGVGGQGGGFLAISHQPVDIHLLYVLGHHSAICGERSLHTQVLFAPRICHPDTRVCWGRASQLLERVCRLCHAQIEEEIRLIYASRRRNPDTLIRCRLYLSLAVFFFP